LHAAGVGIVVDYYSDLEHGLFSR